MQQIKDGIGTVINGGSTLDPNVARFMMDTLKNKLPDLNAENLLSCRELETLQLMGEGLARKEIAQKLKLSVFTVDTHIRHIYDKFNVPNSAAAVNRAHRLGIFD